MKKCIGFLLAMLLLSVASASAQIAFGVKGGLNISKVHFNSDLIDSDNLTGFQIGPMMEFIAPAAGVGMDVALIYSQKGLELKSENLKTDYLDIPVNLKWKFGLPVFKGYVSAGPYASFRIGGDKVWKVVDQQIKAKNFGAGLNFGAGVEVIKHLQVGVNYDLGLTNNYSAGIGLSDADKAAGKLRGWSVTAAILF
ncbi:porin family protein [Massilibacteroides sp.]|uniref:porin family protein n=1 Tax=Massilibacteroides sp. TaxID=2034766 RepID=UPI00262F12B7|nr:porin family protein [Massilibacteroides sp.]MDD4514984.1 porin family protein [Massilibacteroides sp.]